MMLVEELEQDLEEQLPLLPTNWVNFINIITRGFEYGN